MGVQNFLKSMAGKHSKSGAGASAPAPGLPAMDPKTLKTYKKVGDELDKIKAKMRGIADEKGMHSSLEKLAKKARRMEPLKKAIADVVEAEENYLKLLKDETSSIHAQTKAYNKLAAAKKKQVQVGNEVAGGFGRMKNVLASFTKVNVLLGAFAIVGRDVMLIARQANEGFDVMARGGQALGKSVWQLTEATASYSLALNKASITGALMGHSNEDSRKAFQLLSQTFGGTSGAIADVSTNFGELAMVAKFSGMSMGDAAAFADKNFKRLGKSITDSTSDIALMGMNTQNLNHMFGKGKVDSQAYAQTISDLAFQSGNYNQNTRFLIESLNRELAVQLALGKSRDAAMEAAKRNLDKAGKANLAASIWVGKQLQIEYDKNPGKFAAEALEKFGSQSKIILKILEQGVSSGNNQMALAEVMKNSTSLQGRVNKEVRRDAAAGGDKGLAWQTTKSVGEQELLKIQESIIAGELAKIRAAQVGDWDTVKASLHELFPGVAEIEDPAQKAEAQEKIEQLARDLRSDPTLDAREEFAKLFEAVLPAKDPEKDKDPVDKFLEAVGGGKHFMTALGALAELPGVVGDLPMIMVAALALDKLNESKTGPGAFIKSWFTKDEDYGTKQIMTRRGPKFTEAQMATAQAKLDKKKKLESYGARYDAGKAFVNPATGKGMAEVEGKTREEFITQLVKADEASEAGKILGENIASDTTFGDLTQLGDPAAAAAMVEAVGGEALATKLAPVIGDETGATSTKQPGGSRRIPAKVSREGNGTVILEVDGNSWDTASAQGTYDNSAIADGQ